MASGPVWNEEDGPLPSITSDIAHNAVEPGFRKNPPQMIDAPA